MEQNDMLTSRRKILLYVILQSRTFYYKYTIYRCKNHRSFDFFKNHLTQQLYYCIICLTQKYRRKGGDIMAWNLDSDRPIFSQIVERIQTDIIAGKYEPGGKLPSVRELAQEASVNPNTMQKAFAELERIGLVYSRRTSGRFITEDIKMIESAKTTLAQQEMNRFLEIMQKLGYSRSEILDLLNQTLKKN